LAVKAITKPTRLAGEAGGEQNRHRKEKEKICFEKKEHSRQR